MAHTDDLAQEMAAFGDALAAASREDVAKNLRDRVAEAEAAVDARAPRRTTLADVIKAWTPWKHQRHEKGSPDGGKFKGNGGVQGMLGFMTGAGRPKPKVTVTSAEDDWKKDPFYSDGKGTKPKPKPPSSAVPHPHRDNHGDEVLVHYPTKPSPEIVWDDPESTATFVPGGMAPPALNGIDMVDSFPAPKDAEGWLNVPGQNPDVEAGFPDLTAPKGKSIGAGVIIQEPDGRVWIVSPTNRFGGYHQTFPKGTYEDDIASLQANAIKEAYEESGLQVEITGVLGDFQRTTSMARFYLAKRIGGSPANMGWESQAVRLAPVSHLRDWLNRDNIDHPIVEAFEAYTGVDVGKAFDEAKVNRWPKGSPLGGQFKDAGSAATGGFTSPPKIGWKKDGSGPGANPKYYNQMVAMFQAAQKGDMTVAQSLYEEYADAADMFGSGEKMNSHGKWKAQVHQYAFDLIVADADMKALATKAQVLDADLGAQKISLWKMVGEKPGGTAPGGLYTDELGQKWLVKGNLQGKDDDRARNEVLAAKLMAAAGIPAPTYKLVDLGGQYGGGLGVATKWEDGLSKIATPGQKFGARSQFAVHAWLGNWDVVGMGGDNMLVRPSGEVVNIDPGGALLYRAQGKAKTASEFSVTPDDWNTMRDPKKNADAAGLFGAMSKGHLDESGTFLMSVTDEKIVELVNAYGPQGGATSKDTLIAKLIGRRDAILQMTGNTVPGSEAYAPVKVPAMPKPPRVPKAAKTGDLAVTPPTVSKGGKAAESIETMQKSETIMGPPNKSSVPLLESMSNTWLTNAQNTEGKAKYDALQAAVYYAKLSNFHNGMPVVASAAIHSQMGEYIYGSTGEYWKAQDKFDPANGIPTEATGDDGGEIIPPTTPDLTIKDMDDAESYSGAAYQAAISGKQPKPPKIESYASGIAWLQDKYGEGGKGAMAGTHADLMAGNLYTNTAASPGPAESAMDGYGKAMATYWTGQQEAAVVPASSIKLVETADSPKKTLEAVAAYDAGMKLQAEGPAPAAPDFASFKTTSAANPAHNKKVDLIAQLHGVGNVSGILGLNYGTNTYGKKQAALANDALASLGSDQVVTIGQKAGEHPALTGKPSVEFVPPKPAAKPLVINKADLPTKPTFTASKKAWKNQANSDAVDAIEKEALEADLVGLKALTYAQQTDNDEGTLTGKNLPFSAHPSPKIQQYWQDSVNFVDDKLNPPKPLEPVKTIKAASLAKIAAAFPTVPLLKTVEALPQNQRMGFWAVLGNVEASREALMPGGAAKDLSSAFREQVKTAYNKASNLSKKFMSSVQASGGINSAYNSGNSNYNGIDLIAAATSMEADAIELPEGSTTYKWIQMPANMRQALMKAPVGTVLQNPGSACNSMSPANTKGFGPEVRIVYRAAKGAKMMPSWGSGSHNHEQELTSLPGARMVLLGAKQVSDSIGTRFEIEVTLLPPHKNSLSTKL